MNADEVAPRVEEALADTPATVRRVNDARVDVDVPSVDDIEAAVEALVGDGIRFLSSITGVNEGDHVELLYHFYARGGPDLRTLAPGVDVTLRVPVEIPDPEAELHVPSVTDAVPGASLYEREVGEMFGIVFDGHPDQTQLLLPDNWDEAPPRRRAGEGNDGSETGAEG